MLHNAILAQNFNGPDEMFEWIFSLPGSTIEYEDAPDAEVDDIRSIAFNFYPVGAMDAPPGALLAVVVVSTKEPDVLGNENQL